MGRQKFGKGLKTIIRFKNINRLEALYESFNLYKIRIIFYNFLTI